MRYVLDHGHKKSDRTGTGTLSTFGWQMRFNLNDGFPLLTTKKLFTRGIIRELLWFLMGHTNIQYLKENGVGIWDDWADANGDLGPVYGKQWRHWETYKFAKSEPTTGIDLYKRGKDIDQIKDLIDGLKNNPDSRRHIVTAWNPADVPQMKLPPCHALFQFYVASGKLSCQLYQRSADIFLGVPFNIASYALLTMMMAQICGLESGEFIHTLGDAHLYSNHLDQALLQLTREPKPLPQMIINPDVKDILSFKFEDFQLVGYDASPHIHGAVAV